METFSFNFGKLPVDIYLNNNACLSYMDFVRTQGVFDEKHSLKGKISFSNKSGRKPIKPRETIKQEVLPKVNERLAWRSGRLRQSALHSDSHLQAGTLPPPARRPFDPLEEEEFKMAMMGIERSFKKMALFDKDDIRKEKTKKDELNEVIEMMEVLKL